MSRGTSEKIANQGIDVSKQDSALSQQNQRNAQNSYNDTNKSIGDYNANLKGFMDYGNKTYGEGGDFAKDMNVRANTTAAAANAATAGNLALNAGRTGANTAGYAGTLAESTRGGARDMTAELASADSERLKNLTGIQQTGLDASKFPAQLQAQMYGTGAGAAVGSLGNAGNALGPAGSASASAPGAGDWTADFLQKLAASGASAYSKSGCWIAEACFGEDDLRTHILRFWLNEVYAKTKIGRVVMALYIRFGQRIARLVRRSSWLKRIFTKLFNRVLPIAERDCNVFAGRDGVYCCTNAGLELFIHAV